MKNGKRSPRFACLFAALCLSLAATPALAEESDEGQDPPRVAQGSMASAPAGSELALDLVTGTASLLLRIAML
jgi:hypothetical protein